MFELNVPADSTMRALEFRHILHDQLRLNGYITQSQRVLLTKMDKGEELHLRGNAVLVKPKRKPRKDCASYVICK